MSRLRRSKSAEASRTFHTHQELFNEIASHWGEVRASHGLPRDFIPADDVSETTIDFGNHQQLWEHFELVRRVVRMYMAWAGIIHIHVRVPIGCELPDGSVRSWAEETYHDEYLFVASITVGDGIHYSLIPVGGPTLVEVYDEIFEEPLTKDNAERLSKSVDRKRKIEALADADRSYFTNFVPQRSEAVRGYLDSLFFDFRSTFAMARRLALYSLYYPEVALWMGELYNPWSGIRRSEGGRPDKYTIERFQEELRDRLLFLASMRPLIEARIVIPVRIPMFDEDMMQLWLDAMSYYAYEYESDYLKLVEGEYGDTRDVSVVEHMEVYCQENAQADLCGAHNVYTDNLFSEFTRRLLDECNVQRAEQFKSCDSALILDRAVLPSLVDVSIEELIALRQSAQHLGMFREDMNNIFRHLSEAAIGGSVEDGRFDQISEALLAARLDALNRDLRRSSLNEHVKQAGISFSIGALVGTLTGDPLSSIVAASTTEATLLGFRGLRGRRERGATEILAKLYASLVDSNRQD